MSLMICPECGKEVSDRAESCPNCGYPISQKKQITLEQTEKTNNCKIGLIGFIISFLGFILSIGGFIIVGLISIAMGIISLAKKENKKWLAISAIIVSVLGFALSPSNSTKNSHESNSSTIKSSFENDQKETIAFNTRENSQPVQKSEAIDKTIKDDLEASDEEIPSQTTGQKNALSTARSYLNYSAFSYQGLIEQLEYEKYSHDDAVYAADNCNADWNEQALDKANSYLDFSAFSYKGLIEQLEYEKFTKEQATYGADNCNANWNEQAAKQAESYLSFSAFSRDALIDQLEYEGFTHEQAIYGAEANGY